MVSTYVGLSLLLLASARLAREEGMLAEQVGEGLLPGQSFGVEALQRGVAAPQRARTLRMAEPGERALRIAGFSVAPSGFVALLSDAETGRVIPVPVTERQRDQEEASSPEALTLLQLFQGVDLAGFALPPERLETLVAQRQGADPGAALQLLEVLVDDDAGQQQLTLRVQDLGRTAPPFDVPCDGAVAFDAIALAMRYKASIAATEVALATALGEAEAAARFPQAFSVSDAQAQDGRVRRDFASKMAEATQGSVSADPSAAMPWWDNPGGSKHLITKTPSETSAVPAKLLEKALAIAQAKGDKEAELKIREALREAGENGLPWHL